MGHGYRSRSRDRRRDRSYSRERRDRDRDRDRDRGRDRDRDRDRDGRDRDRSRYCDDRDRRRDRSRDRDRDRDRDRGSFSRHWSPTGYRYAERYDRTALHYGSKELKHMALLRMRKDELRGRNTVLCDDCGKEKPREYFSKSQLYGPKQAGSMRHDPERAVRCKDCVEHRTVESCAVQKAGADAKKALEASIGSGEGPRWYCKVCTVQLNSAVQHQQHIGGTRHKRNLQWYQQNPQAAIKDGLQGHPELSGLADVKPQTAVTAPLATPVAAAPGTPVVAARPVGARPPGVPVVAAVPVSAGAAPPPPVQPVAVLNPHEIIAERISEDRARESLEAALQRHNLPSIDADDSLIHRSFDEEGIGRAAQWRCTADFEGQEGGPPGLSVVGDPRPSKEAAEKQVFLQLLRGLDEWAMEQGLIAAPTAPVGRAPALAAKVPPPPAVAARPAFSALAVKLPVKMPMKLAVKIPAPVQPPLEADDDIPPFEADDDLPCVPPLDADDGLPPLEADDGPPPLEAGEDPPPLETYEDLLELAEPPPPPPPLPCAF